MLERTWRRSLDDREENEEGRVGKEERRREETEEGGKKKERERSRKGKGAGNMSTWRQEAGGRLHEGLTCL